MKQTRIFLACADERLKLALLMLLDHQPGMVVAGMSDRLPGLLRQLEASLPDVLVLDRQESLPTMEERITNIHNLACAPAIVYLSNQSGEKETILAAGADYFVEKNAPPDELITVLENLRSPETNNPDNRSI